MLQYLYRFVKGGMCRAVSMQPWEFDENLIEGCYSYDDIETVLGFSHTDVIADVEKQMQKREFEKYAKIGFSKEDIEFAKSCE